MNRRLPGKLKRDVTEAPLRVSSIRMGRNTSFFKMKAAVFRSISRPVFSVKINVWKSWHFREGCHVVPTIRVGDAINISMCGKRMRYIRSKHFSALYWKRKIWNGLKFERKKKIPKPNWSFWNNQMKQQMSEDNEKQTAKTQNKTKKPKNSQKHYLFL